MADLKSIKRPSIALIKLIEATGILLQIPKTATFKSKYKAPVPTNYDDTVEYLSVQFYPAMNALVNLTDAEISNDVACEFYAKILEPGFSYEDALKDGGLASRELFNLVYLIMLKLQGDQNRLPVQKINVMAVVDGSRSSYVALDLATHIYGHGVCSIGALTIGEAKSSIMREHLLPDIQRRCKNQYKLPLHCVRFESLSVQNEEEVIPTLQQALTETASEVLVLGMQECNIGLDSLSPALVWAAWTCKIPVVLAKGKSRMRDFNSVITPRVCQVCVKNLGELRATFLKSLVFMRPGDSLVVACVVKSKNGRADDRESRYDGGRRSGWVTTTGTALPDFSPEYSEEYVQNLRTEINMFIEKAQVIGRVRIEEMNPLVTVGQVLCKIAQEERVDLMVLKNRVNREIITECARDAPCSVALIK